MANEKSTTVVRFEISVTCPNCGEELGPKYPGEYCIKCGKEMPQEQKLAVFLHLNDGEPNVIPDTRVALTAEQLGDILGQVAHLHRHGYFKRPTADLQERYMSWKIEAIALAAQQDEMNYSQALRK